MRIYTLSEISKAIRKRVSQATDFLDTYPFNLSGKEFYIRATRRGSDLFLEITNTSGKLLAKTKPMPISDYKESIIYFVTFGIAALVSAAIKS